MFIDMINQKCNEVHKQSTSFEREQSRQYHICKGNLQNEVCI